MTNINTLYSIKPVVGTKPKRYHVCLGTLPLSRQMSKADAEQWLMLQTGELEYSDIALAWNGTSGKSSR